MFNGMFNKLKTVIIKKTRCLIFTLLLETI